MIPILPICEIIVGKIGPDSSSQPKVPHSSAGIDKPRKKNIIVETVELHVLQAPSFIDPSRDMLLAQTREVRGVVHA